MAELRSGRRKVATVESTVLLWGAGNGNHLGHVEVKESPGEGAWVQPWEAGARPGFLSSRWMLLSREHPALQ